MTLHQLRIFWAVAHANSLTKASKRLGLTQPSPSQNLSKLEGTVGSRPFARNAGQLKVANVQYYGWAMVNRAALMPTRAQLVRSTELVEEARERLKGTLVIDYV